MWVHWTLVAVGWLGWYFCGYAIFLFAWTLWKHARPKHARRWMHWVASWMKLKEKGAARIERVWATSVVLLCSVIFVFAATRPPKFPIVEEHNVADYGQITGGDWWMHSDEEGYFAFRPCPDFDVDGVLKPGVGYIAPRARWEERGNCKSIRAIGLGFWWLNSSKQYTMIAKER